MRSSSTQRADHSACREPYRRHRTATDHRQATQLVAWAEDKPFCRKCPMPYGDTLTLVVISETAVEWLPQS
jgi:hypothetical protein